MPGDALVQAHHHHPASTSALGVQLLELVGDLLLVGGRAEAGEVGAGDVVEVHGVGHGGERLAVDQLQERLVGGQVVDVVREAELLQDLQGVDTRPDPVVVIAGWPGTGDLLDRLDAVSDPLFLLRAGQVVLALPGPAVRAGLMPRATISAATSGWRRTASPIMNEVILMLCLSKRSRRRGTPSRAPYS
jgi:hypothetical protein